MITRKVHTQDFQKNAHKLCWPGAYEVSSQGYVLPNVRLPGMSIYPAVLPACRFPAYTYGKAHPVHLAQPAFCTKMKTLGGHHPEWGNTFTKELTQYVLTDKWILAQNLRYPRYVIWFYMPAMYIILERNYLHEKLFTLTFELGTAPFKQMYFSQYFALINIVSISPYRY